jgi:uncharacterized membrane protein YidH (DUF202 family)
MRLVDVLQAAGAIVGVLASAFTVVEKRLLARFRSSGATSPEDAMEATSLGVLLRCRVSRLTSVGAVVEVSDGRLYLDEQAYSSLRKRRVVLGVTLVVVALALVALVHTALR